MSGDDDDDDDDDNNYGDRGSSLVIDSDEEMQSGVGGRGRQGHKSSRTTHAPQNRSNNKNKLPSTMFTLSDSDGEEDTSHRTTTTTTTTTSVPRGPMTERERQMIADGILDYNATPSRPKKPRARTARQAVAGGIGASLNTTNGDEPVTTATTPAMNDDMDGAQQQQLLGKRKQPDTPSGGGGGGGATGNVAENAPKKMSRKMQGCIQRAKNVRARHRDAQTSIVREAAGVTARHHVLQQATDEVRALTFTVNAIERRVNEVARQAVHANSNIEHALSQLVQETLKQVITWMHDMARMQQQSMDYINGMYAHVRNLTEESADAEHMFVEHICDLHNGRTRMAMMEYTAQRREHDAACAAVSGRPPAHDSVAAVWDSGAKQTQLSMLTASRPLLRNTNAFSNVHTPSSARSKRGTPRSSAGAANAAVSAPTVAAPRPRSASASTVNPPI